VTPLCAVGSSLLREEYHMTRKGEQKGPVTDRPTRSRFSVVFLGPRANAELVPKFHVALHASNAALQILTFQNLSP
jgi:hypothetical protein